MIERRFPLNPAGTLADEWARFIDPKSKRSAWVTAMRRFGDLGGLVRYYCGVPGYRIMPLGFACHAPDGTELDASNTLAGIRQSIVSLEARSA